MELALEDTSKKDNVNLAKTHEDSAERLRYLVVVPAYNEADNIEDVVRGVMRETEDVLVIDDGSVDATHEVLSRLEVRFLRQRHGGKGAALKAGFSYAIKNGYDWVITMDGDGQHDFAELSKFKEAVRANGTDMVIGSRMDSTEEMPVVRLVTNRFMSHLLSRIAGRKVSDTQCGFRAIRCALLKEIKLNTSHYDTESELLIKAVRAGFSVSSIPVKTIYNGSKSNVNKVVDTVRFVRLLWRMLRHG